MDDILQSLNERQIEAVTATEGFLRVVAGAGTGKTKALTHRFAYLVKAGGIHPRNILCVTFTNKAAGEMKRRVRRLVGDGYDTSLITTYHGFCVRVLRPDMDKLFYPQNFLILDTGDQKKILEEIYEELEIKLDYASFQKMLRHISRLKADTAYVAGLTDPSHSFDPGAAENLDDKIALKYLQRQKKVFGLDFDDLVNFTFYLFDKHPDIRAKWQEQLHYIQVDEIQDSSRREMRLLDVLCAENGNLFVVGDPDQNIYEWRGARVEILVDFDKDHEDTRTIILNQNYRSTPQILAVANSLIDKNAVRVKKDLFTQNPSGASVIHLHAKDEKSETEWMVKEIKAAVKAGRKYGDFAMLYRASFLSRYLEQALINGEVPYRIWGGARFFDRMEIRDMLAYLRMAAFRDDLSFLRIINVPRRQMGKNRVSYLKARAEEDGVSLYDALKLHMHDNALRNSGAESFVRLVEYFSEMAETMQPSELLQKLMAQSGYEKYIRENGDMERLDNLAELYKTVTEFERGYGEPVRLEEYLRHVALQYADSEREDDSDAVRLMTVHAAKGLEFPFVFVVGLNEGVFPSSRTIEERAQAGLEEERRLCFVAMTRAMERLYLTESEGFGTGGGRKLPSRFLFDVEEGLYERIGVISQELLDEMRKKSGAPFAAAAERLAAGARVKHPLFGGGEIASVDEAGGVYYVRFDKTGKVKPIKLDFAFDVPGEEPAAAPEILVPEVLDELPDEPDEYEFEDIPELYEEEIIAEVDLDAPPESAADTSPRELTRDPNETNLWKRADVPHSGWTCVGIHDLGAPSGICGMCGYQTIRYVHMMTHPDYPGSVGAGCVCAGKMEGDPERAASRERAYKNTLARRVNFMKRAWKRSAKGNLYIKYQTNIIVLLPDKFQQGQWKYMLNGAISGTFPSQDAAKLGAFDAVLKLTGQDRE